MFQTKFKLDTKAKQDQPLFRSKYKDNAQGDWYEKNQTANGYVLDQRSIAPRRQYDQHLSNGLPVGNAGCRRCWYPTPRA